MGRTDIIKRIEKLEEEIISLRAKERELAEIRYKCEHIAVVDFEWGAGSLDSKCIICGEKFRYSRDLTDVKNIINMNDGEYSYLFPNDKYSLVKGKYLDILTKNPDLSDSEIVELIKKELKL